jgi:hypothetical protein
MPLTPFHVFPAGTIYLLTYRYLHGLAFFLATLLIDIEPALYTILVFPCQGFLFSSAATRLRVST